MFERMKENLRQRQEKENNKSEKKRIDCHYYPKRNYLLKFF